MQHTRLLNFYKSTRKDKKYDVYDANSGEYVVSFGGIRQATGVPYEQYHDSIGLYTDYDHESSHRRKNYIKRHFHGAKNKSEALKMAKPYTSSWFSLLYLW